MPTRRSRYRLLTARPSEPPAGSPGRAWRRCLGPIEEEHYLLSEHAGHRLCRLCEVKLAELSRSQSRMCFGPVRSAGEEG